MKATTLMAVLLTAPLCSLGQGKVNVVNDGASPVVCTTDTSRLRAADVGLAGQAVGNSVPFPSGMVLSAGLYGGTSSSSLFLYSSTLLNNSSYPAGYIPSFHVVLNAQANGAPAIPGIASGTAIGASTPWFQIKIWDSAYPNFEAAFVSGGFATTGVLFQMNPGPSISYTFTAPPGPNSTWVDGPFIVPGWLDPPRGVYITAQPTNETVFQGTTASFSVTAFSSYLLHYQWLFNGSPIPGAVSAAYQIPNAQTTNAGTYSVRVFNGYTSVSGGSATLTVLVSPHLTSTPASQTAEEGATVGFSASATGDLPLMYQWFFNGTTALTSATTNASLQVANVHSPQAGAYAVVVANVAGAVTSPPAMLSVIPPVPRRMVPGLTLLGQTGSALNLDYAPSAAPSPNWAAFDSVTLTNPAQWYFDLTAPLSAQRFYRAWDTNPISLPSALDLHMIPALTLTGAIGNSVRVDCINQVGPIDAWVNLATVTLTNASELYFDTSVIGQPPRLWRLVPVP